MSVELVGLAVLMFAVTYPSRAVGLLVPGVHRLPKPALDYLRLVGPAVLTAIGAVSVLVRVPEGGAPAFEVGVDSVAVVAALLVTARRRNLLLGIVVAVAIAVVARAVGLA